MSDTEKTAAPISISAIHIRDTDAQKDTSILLPLSGGILDTTKLPKNWSLSVYFSSSPEVDKVHSGASFSIDGGATVYQEAPPYVVNNKHPGGPLGLKAGNHTLQWTADGLPLQTINFLVTNGSPLVVTSTGTLGSNGEGIINAPNYDPTLHPIIGQTFSDMKWSVMRLWTEGTIGGGFPSSEWTLPQKWAKIGVKVIAVLNFANSKNRCQAPTDADWLAQINSIPNASQTGVWAFEIGNEIDTNGAVTRDDVYWIGTPAQYTHLMQLAYPILNDKGYQVIMGNVLRSLSYYETLLPLGAFNYCDLIGIHFYNSTAAANLSFVDSLIAFAATVKKGVACTEGNVRCSTSQANAQIAEQQQGLSERNGIFCTFPLINGDDPLDSVGPIGSNLQESPYYASYKTQ